MQSCRRPYYTQACFLDRENLADASVSRRDFIHNFSLPRPSLMCTQVDRIVSMASTSQQERDDAVRDLAICRAEQEEMQTQLNVSKVFLVQIICTYLAAL